MIRYTKIDDLGTQLSSFDKKVIHVMKRVEKGSCTDEDIKFIKKYPYEFPNLKIVRKKYYTIK